MTASIFVPIRLGRGLNDREHFWARTKRVKKEKRLIGWALRSLRKPALPCVVLLTRHAPGNGLDSDNLRGSLKAARDAVADWLGVDDRDETLVAYKYDQIKQAKAWGLDVTLLEVAKQ